MVDGVSRNRAEIWPEKIPAPIPVNTMTLVICFEKQSIKVRRNGIGLADFNC